MELITAKQNEALEQWYSTLVPELANIYRRHDITTHNIGQSFLTDMGKDLKELQDEVASHDKTQGTFGQWLEIKGINRGTAYRLINRFNYLFTNCENIDAFEALPAALSYEVSKPSALPEANEAVFNGEVTTHKEYKELEARLKAEQDEKEKLNKELSESKQALNFALSAPPKLVEKEVILENPKHLQTIQELQQANQKAESQLYNLSIEKDKLEKDLKLYKAIDGEYDKKQKEIRDMQIKIKEVEFLTQKSAKELQAITSLDNFVKKTDLFLKDNLLEMSFAELKDNPLLNQTKSEAVKRFQMLIDWIKFCSNKLGVEL